MEGTASNSAQGLSSSLHQEPDHAKDLEVVAKFGGTFGVSSWLSGT